MSQLASALPNPPDKPFSSLLLGLHAACAGVTRPPALLRYGATRVVAVSSGSVAQLRMAKRGWAISLRLAADRAPFLSWEPGIVDGRLTRGHHLRTIPAHPQPET